MDGRLIDAAGAGLGLRTRSAARSSPPSHVRPPQQERTREGWERILTAGSALLEQGGHAALTIAAVCDRAGVRPPTIYARVDGISGLFWAIYEHRQLDIQITYLALLDDAARMRAGSEARIRAVVTAVSETFRRHDSFLRPIIILSLTDERLAQRGYETSMALLRRVIDLLPSPDVTANWDVARMLHQECMFRTIHGARWLSRETEFDTDFCERLVRMTLGRLSVSAPAPAPENMRDDPPAPPDKVFAKRARSARIGSA